MTQQPTAELPDSDPNPDASPDHGPTTPTTTPTDQPARGGAHFASAPHRAHGTGIRGAMLSRQSSQFEGRFGRMFRTLPGAAHSEQALSELARYMRADREEPATPETKLDEDENVGISAGYTYLGQFIDHDLTFDPASSLQRQNDPDGLVNFRTPRFDLDCLYGRGPDDQPYLYAGDGIHMLLGRPLVGSDHDPGARDLPRNTPNPNEPSRALIGDPRNDENVIIAQLHATMLRFHNRMADLLAASGPLPSFEQVQREVRFHYQWLVLHDFLPTIIGEKMVHDILPPLSNSKPNQPSIFKPNLEFFSWQKAPFIPVEFSVAAYRFGHSMVRPLYRLSTSLNKRPEIFARRIADSLVGFRAFPRDWAIDWNLFFKIDANPPSLGPNRLQPSYKIDTSLVEPLGRLPRAVAKDKHALAERNLLRGLRMSLPSGQAVARAMGLPLIAEENLWIGSAPTDEKGNPSPRLSGIAPDFEDNAPLWFYILAEAQQAALTGTTPVRLGPVGGRIVGEVFVGLLHGDSQSYLQQNPGWQPRRELTRNGNFGMAELILATRV